VQEHCFYHLEAPIVRVTGWDTPYPPPSNGLFPGPDRVAEGLRARWKAKGKSSRNATAEPIPSLRERGGPGQSLRPASLDSRFSRE